MYNDSEMLSIKSTYLHAKYNMFTVHEATMYAWQ